MPANKWRLQYNRAPYLFIAPFFASFLLFSFVPFIYSLYASFTKWNGFEGKQFTGLENYSYLIQDPTFWSVIWNGVLIFILHVPLMLFLALILAVFLNRPLMKLKSLYRTTIYLPNIITVVAVAFVFSMLFNKQEGLVNTLLMNLKMIRQPIEWLETPFWARVTVSLMVLYRWTGYNMLLFLAGLQNIHPDLYESANVDGATKFQCFFYITLPNIKRIFLFCTVLSTIGTFALFTEPFILTKGGPLGATLTPVLYLYREGFQNLNFGYASTIAVAFFMIMMLLTILQLRFFKD